MLECLIIGDSIGVGISQQRPECAKNAYSGIASRTWKIVYGGPMNAKSVVISLGSNDHDKIDTLAELYEIRKSITAEKVLWVLPAKKFDKQRTVVKTVAMAYNDVMLEIPQLSADKVHPTGIGYKKLAEMTK